MSQANTIVVDGANLAYTEKTNQGKPQVSNIMAVYNKLKDLGYAPVVIVDASLRYEVADQEQYDAMTQKQIFRQAPAGTEADYFVLATAQEHDCKFVSNDQFEDYQDRFPWIEDRRVPVMVIKGKVELYKPALNENGQDEQGQHQEQ